MKDYQTIESQEMVRVYVFSLPVRIFHWINALSIVILCVTGYIMGNPPAIASAQEASFSYWFGIVRFIHFLTAWIFVINGAFRVYLSFVGNRYEKWYNFIPIRWGYFTEIWEVMKVDVLQSTRKPHMTIGHNALAGFSYILLFLAFVFQVVTGFGLYASMSDSWIVGLFTWVSPLFGGDIAVRFWHHAVMWFFVIFSIIHVYLVFYHDFVEGRGEISSMGGGWKFIEKSILQKKGSGTILERELRRSKIAQRRSKIAR